MRQEQEDHIALAFRASNLAELYPLSRVLSAPNYCEKMECRCSAGACCQDPILCVLGHVWSRVLASGKSPANDGGTQLRPNSDLVFDSWSSSISATSCASARSAIKKTHTSDSQEIQKKKKIQAHLEKSPSSYMYCALFQLQHAT